MKTRFHRKAAAFMAALLLSAPAARGAEGMWTFDNFPSARMQSELHWAPDQAWLDHVQAGVARLPNCSASVVSSQGLVLTNEHCLTDCLEAASPDDGNFVEAGFSARARKEELRCPGLALQVLVDITDVTPRIQAAAAAAPEGFARARDAEIARIVEGCAGSCEVETLYEGGRYALYRYRRFDDVRLVFAPERAMAAFGGDADNFEFPRYAADFAFLRVYEHDAPAATPAHLTMLFGPISANDVVIAAGNPGSTLRLQTAAQLAFLRDVELPWRIGMLTQARQRMAIFAQASPEHARIAEPTMLSLDNASKAFDGWLLALRDPAQFARVTARDADLQERVHRNLAARRDIGDAWGDIAHAETANATAFLPYQYLELRAGERSQLFAWARDIVRGAAERAKPETERLPRYRNDRLWAVTRGLQNNAQVDPAWEALNLQIWLESVRAQLPARITAVAHVFGGESAAVLAQRLSQSRLADSTYRQQLWDGGASALAASDDPMIQFVLRWDGDARAARSRYETLVAAPIARAQERIAQARFRAFELSQYPDATFSPRLSYGRVEGWSEDERSVAAFTRLGELYEQAGAPPRALTPAWERARGALDPQTVFNLVTSTDLIGGSSGSALLDREGRVIGVVFDGNVHSLGGEFFYDGTLNRSISVSSAAIAASLSHVYGMNDLVGELQGVTPAPRSETPSCDQARRRSDCMERR
ncbi:MAG: S46 family peptidase [Proteobacteria bacterium]|nr:S46 family peptidase [Pseudomonadota bacterium]